MVSTYYYSFYFSTESDGTINICQDSYEEDFPVMSKVSVSPAQLNHFIEELLKFKEHME